MMNTSDYYDTHQSSGSSRFGNNGANLPWKKTMEYDAAAGGMTEFYSPRTITLGNSSNSILRGMVHDDEAAAAAGYHTMMWTSSQTQTQQQPEDGLLRQASASTRQPPYLPSMRISPSAASSRPIRITRRKPAWWEYPSNQTKAQPARTGDEHLSASPRELKHFYDEATWRMFHLIQEARLEKQEAQAAAIVATEEEEEHQDLQEQHLQPLSQDDGMDYLRKDAFLRTDRTPPRSIPSLSSNMLVGPAIVAPDYDENVDEDHEGVFELDDL